MAMKKHIWIGRRLDFVTYEISLTKKGWDSKEGWEDPIETFCKEIENIIGIKLQPGEVAKLELNLVRSRK